jgi:hypothetical protein
LSREHSPTHTTMTVSFRINRITPRCVPENYHNIIEHQQIPGVYG